MSLFNRLGRALLAALAVVGLAGCSKKSGQETVPESPDALPVTHDTFTDPRDGNVYRTVRIGNQVWMAENLRYNIEDSWCYDNDEANCQKYGRLYTWDAAKKACPAGWRLPTKEEWYALEEVAGGLVAGKHLKSKTGWNPYSGITNEDTYGFSALSGSRHYSDGNFDDIGDFGQWWTATECDVDLAYLMEMSYYGNDLISDHDDKSDAISVRCVKDD